MTPADFRSPLAPWLTRYLARKRALGRQAVTMTYIFRRLDRFLVSSHADDLTLDTFNAWDASLTSLKAVTRRAWCRVVYHFCLFRRREESQAFVPDPMQFPRQSPRPLPYIFSESDITRLLVAADRLDAHPGSPLHREAARLAIVALYTTGMRRGEMVRLTLADYEAPARSLRIRKTKFGKARLVPVSPDTGLEFERYLAARRQLGAPREDSAPLLVHVHGPGFRGYSDGGFSQLVRRVIRRAEIRTAHGRYPRIHDLRFTFAVHALQRWYRAGVNVQTRLPALARYLGHVSVVSTAYYLPLVEATAEAASERFHAQCAAWLSLDGGQP